MTISELISQLSKYDKNLEVVIVDKYGEPLPISYCSPQTLDESKEMFLTIDDESNEDCEEVVSIWPEC